MHDMCETAKVCLFSCRVSCVKYCTQHSFDVLLRMLPVLSLILHLRAVADTLLLMLSVLFSGLHSAWYLIYCLSLMHCLLWFTPRSVVLDTHACTWRMLSARLYSAMCLTRFLSSVVYLVFNTVHNTALDVSNMQVPEGDYSFLFQRGGKRPKEEDRHPQ